MYMIEILLFTHFLVVKYGGKKCQSYLIPSQSWQKSYTFQTLMMSLTILQNMICLIRRVTTYYYIIPKTEIYLLWYYYFTWIIIGDTYSNVCWLGAEGTEVGKRGRNSLVQIKGTSSHWPSFCGRRIPEQQEVASEWGKYYFHIM